MPNPNPSRATRFKPGQSGNPKGTSGPQRATILRAIPAVRSLAEIEADALAWKGTPRQLFESVARDPEHPLDLRLHAAAVLLKHEADDDGVKLTSDQRQRRIAELMAQMGPPVIDGAAERSSAFYLVETDSCEDDPCAANKTSHKDDASEGAKGVATCP